MKSIIATLLFFAYSFTLSAQNVGIGETAPTAMKLQVKSADSAVLLIQNSTAAGSNIKTGLYYKTGNNYSGGIATIGSGATFRMGLFTYGGATPTSLIERISILDGGNVGIGTTNPTAKLEVAGTFKIVDGNQAAGKVLTSDGSGIATWATPITGGGAFTLPYAGVASSVANLFQIQNSGTGTAIRALNNSSTNAAFKAEASGGADAVEAISNGGGTVTALQNGNGIAVQGLATAGGTGGFFTSSTGYSLITNNGSVGIGNLAPTYKLDINGRARLMHNGNTAGMWHNKADNTEGAFVGMVNDSTYGFFGNGTAGNWRMGFDVKNAQMGIGMTDPTAPLSFPNSTGNKISLWGDATGGHYGLGIQGSLFQIYSSANNADIAFGFGSSSAFTENMRVKGNGNVGIGTNNPSTKLELKTDGYGFSHTGGTVAVKVGSYIDATGGWLGTNSNHPLHFYTNSGFQQMTLLTNGNVGIRNINPTSPLSFTNTTGKKISLYPGGTGDAGFGVFPNELRINSDNVSADITFGYDNFSSGFFEKMRVKGNGNVGIGTNNPSNKLDINGRMRLRNEGGGNTAGMWIDGTSTAQRGFIGALDNDYMGFYGSNGAGWGLLFNETTGQVNMGTTIPATGYLLNVNGKIISEEVRVQLKAAWPDYVFNEGYKKLTLPQLEVYLKENKHLPNIPSAKEIESDGQHLGEIQRKMLEKIEELSLYVIELKKEIDSIKKLHNK